MDGALVPFGQSQGLFLAGVGGICSAGAVSGLGPWSGEGGGWCGRVDSEPTRWYQSINASIVRSINLSDEASPLVQTPRRKQDGRARCQGRQPARQKRRHDDAFKSCRSDVRSANNRADHPN
ncbi:hypothetical protein P170DRAFT_245906 [Aspergillus steynii IBT 23096]|uniref:Uncharacterized protein n=1 Tax=Aspergillus steynii IBT 23096 TaxID=1392250 RepID=A0A2I2FY37_9EURO|nr:uncharacterized protein P170DRAFT_245906 [Aspergillus steynii IBT 23096]PLB45528.1 hypothetical protein P170DRAFT_245906 [Aspergillus steynii IBT 23096]